MAHFIATTEKTSAEELARLFWDQVEWLHRLPENIVSDRGPQFAAEIIKKLNVRVTRAGLPGEFSENRIKLLEVYFILYIQVPLATEHSKGQGQKCRSRQLIKCYVIII